MPRKTTILIIILAIITGVLIYLAVTTEKTQNLVNQIIPSKTPPVVPTIAPYASLSFATPQLNLANSPLATQSVDILIDTNNKPAFGAQIELSYDPKVFYNVSVSKPKTPFFGNNEVVLINSVDPTQGRVSYAVGLPATANEIWGRGTVATLNFSVYRNTGLSSSQFSFLQKSMVTSLKTPNSVLQITTPLNVILTQTPKY